jgi:hypothetical protein
MKSEDRYAALVEMWIHQNTTQFQWPALVLSAVFVAVSVLADKETVTAIVDIKEWGTNPQVQYGVGVPFLLIGVGTLAMTYAMGRNRQVLRFLENELDKEDKLSKLDPKFSCLVHPPGASGAKLIWWFLAFIALATLWLGVLFVAGVNWYLIPIPLIATTAVWALVTFIYICKNYSRNNSCSKLPNKSLPPTGDHDASGQNKNTAGDTSG